MSFGLPQFRITSDDLPDADKKLLRGIGPLLDALNLVLNAIVGALNGLALPTPKSASFTTDAAGVAQTSVGALVLTPSELWLTRLVRSDGTPIAANYSMAWAPKSSGASLSFFGLAASKTYNFTVRYS